MRSRPTAETLLWSAANCHYLVQAGRREALVTARGVSFRRSSVAQLLQSQTMMCGASDQKKELTLPATFTASSTRNRCNA